MMGMSDKNSGTFGCLITSPAMINALEIAVAILAAIWCGTPGARAQQPAPSLPSDPLHFANFAARFAADGAFTLEGPGWPTFKGTWKADGAEIEILTPAAAAGCDQPGRYRFRTENTRTHVRSRVRRRAHRAA